MTKTKELLGSYGTYKVTSIGHFWASIQVLLTVVLSVRDMLKFWRGKIYCNMSIVSQNFRLGLIINGISKTVLNTTKIVAKPGDK